MKRRGKEGTVWPIGRQSFGSAKRARGALDDGMRGTVRSDVSRCVGTPTRKGRCGNAHKSNEKHTRARIYNSGK